MSDTVSQSELQMFLEAQGALAQAQSALVQAQGAFQFVSAHLAKAYGIGPADTIDTNTGAINRAPQPVPAAVEPVQ